MVTNAIGHLAEAAWHHPDILATFPRVEVRLKNHDAGGITDKDFELAKKIEDAGAVAARQEMAARSKVRRPIIATSSTIERMTLLLGTDAEGRIDEAAIRLDGRARLCRRAACTAATGETCSTCSISRRSPISPTMVRAHGMMAGFAGALEPPDIPRLLLLDPDILAFGFDAATIDGIRAQIPAGQEQRRSPAKPAKVDYRLATAAARPTCARTSTASSCTTSCCRSRIGTYARERDKLQNVRFSVDVRHRAPRPTCRPTCATCCPTTSSRTRSA